MSTEEKALDLLVSVKWFCYRQREPRIEAVICTASPGPEIGWSAAGGAMWRGAFFRLDCSLSWERRKALQAPTRMRLTWAESRTRAVSEMLRRLSPRSPVRLRL